MNTCDITPAARDEIDAFKAHLERHKDGSAPDCRFCAEREATQTEAAIRGLTDLMDGAKDAAVRGTAACALGVIARLKAAVSVPPEAASEPVEKVLRDTETYRAMLAQDRYPANFREQAKGVEGVVLPLGSTEAVTRLLRDLVAWGFGMGQAQPESSELLSWHERADATTAKLREHFAASQAENLLLGLHKIVADLAPYFDKPLTEESMPRWLALDSAQKTVAQYFAASQGEAERGGEGATTHHSQGAVDVILNGASCTCPKTTGGVGVSRDCAIHGWGKSARSAGEGTRTLRDAMERASNILRGGPTAADAKVPLAQRVHDAANILDDALLEGAQARQEGR